MKPLLALMLLSLSGASLAAEAYKWVDEKGIVNYGEKPPESRPSKPVDTSPRVVIDTGGQFDKRTAPERPSRPFAETQATAAPPAAPGTRGMEFQVFTQLQRGMTEGELLQRAGKPDHVSLETFDIQKTYYYFPTPGNPYTTAVTLRSGRIHEIDRINKF
jgi:hypothetical protein